MTVLHLMVLREKLLAFRFKHNSGKSFPRSFAMSVLDIDICFHRRIARSKPLIEKCAKVRRGKMQIVWQSNIESPCEKHVRSSFSWDLDSSILLAIEQRNPNHWILRFRSSKDKSLMCTDGATPFNGNLLQMQWTKYPNFQDFHPTHCLKLYLQKPVFC